MHAFSACKREVPNWEFLCLPVLAMNLDYNLLRHKSCSGVHILKNQIQRQVLLWPWCCWWRCRRVVRQTNTCSRTGSTSTRRSRPALRVPVTRQVFCLFMKSHTLINALLPLLWNYVAFYLIKSNFLISHFLFILLKFINLLTIFINFLHFIKKVNS